MMLSSITLQSGRELDIDLDYEEASGDGFHEPGHRASVQLVAVWERAAECTECGRQFPGLSQVPEHLQPQWRRGTAYCLGSYITGSWVRRPAQTTEAEDQEIMALIEEMERDYEDSP